MYCNKCAVKVNEEDFYCFNCGNKLKEEKVVTETNKKPRVKTTPFDVFAIIAMVIGIISLVTLVTNVIDFNLIINGLSVFEYYEFTISINGIILGALGLKSKVHNGKALTGLIMSSVVTVISLVLFILFLI
jgi:hypothetical protein